VLQIVDAEIGRFAKVDGAQVSRNLRFALVCGGNGCLSSAR
jgi:hypothetical protein